MLINKFSGSFRFIATITAIMSRFIAVFFTSMLLGVLIASFVFPVQSQSPVFSGPWHMRPQYLTTTPTNICNMGGINMPKCDQAVWLCTGSVNSSAGTTATVTITDRQSTPVPYWNAIAPLSSTAASWVPIHPPVNPTNDYSGCTYFPGGVMVSASANSTIYIRMGGKW